MAHIPVNPERRDPGFFRKKAEIGLSNVDNISAAEFVDIVSEDLKVINNKKRKSTRITTKGVFYGGILKTAEFNSHAEFTLGLFDTSNPQKELAAVHVDFAYSGTSEDEPGSVNYTIECPDEDPYLKTLYLGFYQVQGQVYVVLHSEKLPVISDNNYFNQIGVNLIDWTDGVTRLDPAKDIAEIVTRGIELAKVRLQGSRSTAGLETAESLAVYNERGQKVSIDSTNYSERDIESYDCPTINGVPFIAKRGLTIGNKEAGRHIEVQAYHKSSDREGAGIHEWEVLGSLEKINLEKTDQNVKVSGSSKIPNSEDNGYGLTKPSRYDLIKFPIQGGQTDLEYASSWLDSLGEDSDVITVGAFREYMTYLLYALGGQEVNTYHLFLKNSKDLYKYVPSSPGNISFDIYSYLENINGGVKTNTGKNISVTCNEDWVSVDDYDINGNLCTLTLTIDANPYIIDRTTKVIVTQEGSSRQLEFNIIQEKYKTEYGFLLNGGTIFESNGIDLQEWENSRFNETLTLKTIKSSNTDPRGYTEYIPESITLTNNTLWINTEFKKTDEGEYELKLSGPENIMSSNKTGTLYFEFFDQAGEKAISNVPFRCTQKSVDSVLSVDGDSTQGVNQYSFGKDTTTKKITVNSNYPWVIDETTIPGWITLPGYTGERASGKSTLTLSISENNTQATRECNMVIVNKAGTQKVLRITQTFRSVYIDINNKAEDSFFSFDWDHDIKTISFKVNSNVNWFIDALPEWITPSVYDGGENGVQTETEVTLSLYLPDEDEDSIVVNETLSLSYYDQETSTIYSLRKINLQSGFPYFNNSNNYVLPQCPLMIDVPASGGIQKISSLADTKYRMVFLNELGGKFRENQSEYETMVEEYSSEIPILSENPKEDKSQFTNLSFTVTKNPTKYERYFKFVLLPENDGDGETYWETDSGKLAVFTVRQQGVKNITPIVSKDEDITNYECNNLGFYINVYQGWTSATPVVRPRSPREKTIYVYDGFRATRGQIIKFTEGEYLFKSETKTLQLGDFAKRIPVEQYYLVEETGWYFTSDGKADVITPRINNYSCNSSAQEFNIDLFCTMNNNWDVYNENIPGWISLEKITGSDNIDRIKVIVDENISPEGRSFDLQFYVDSLERTITSFPITQSGLEVGIDSNTLISITPVSLGKLYYTRDAFRVGLKAIAKYRTILTVGENTYEYTQSEYQETGVNFSVVSSLDGDNDIKARIDYDSYGKPELVVNQNSMTDINQIIVTASYNGQTGNLIFTQGSISEVRYETYSDLVVTPDLNKLPESVSQLGYTIKGTKELHSVNLETGEDTLVSTDSNINLEVYIKSDKYKVKWSEGFSVSCPGTLRSSGLVLDGINRLSLELPYVHYTRENGIINESIESIETGQFTIAPSDYSCVSMDYSMMSGNRVNQILSTKISLIKYPYVILRREDSSTDTKSYIESQTQGVSGIEINSRYGVTNFSAKITAINPSYHEDKIVTYTIYDSSSNLIKYLHFKNTKSLPEIKYNVNSIVYSSGKTTAKVKVESNIGYDTTAWSNNPDFTTITGGYLTTSNAKLSDSRVIEFLSEDQPERLWCKKYSTESLIIRDLDNYGYQKEVPLVLREYEGATQGFRIKFNNTELCSFSDPTGTVRDLYLPSDIFNITLKVTSYDGYTVGCVNNNMVLKNFVIDDPRTQIQSKVGSLKEMDCNIYAIIPNTSKNQRFLGSIQFTSPTKTFTLNLYKSSKSGVANVITPESKIIIVNDDSPKEVTFTHSYSGYHISQYGENRNVIYIPATLMPSFNNMGYNETFNRAGNSGISTEGISTVNLTFPQEASEVINTSLKMQTHANLRENIGSPIDWMPSTFYVRTSTADNLAANPKEIDPSDSFRVLYRPEVPHFGIYETAGGVELEDYDYMVAEAFGLTLRFNVFVYSDILERAAEYVGETLMINGEQVNIYNVFDVYDRLVSTPVLYTRKTNKRVGTVTREPGISEVDGRSFVRYTISYTPNSSSMLPWNNPLKLVFKFKDFVVDPNYYTGVEIPQRIININK